MASFDIKKGKTLIRLAETEFEGRNFIDIRSFYKDKDGEFKPTRKGISMTYPEFVKLAKAVRIMLKDEDFKERLAMETETD